LLLNTFVESDEVVAYADKINAADDERENQSADTTEQPEVPHDASLLVLFFFFDVFFAIVHRRDEPFIFLAFGRLGRGSQLFFLDRLFDDAASAWRGVYRRLVCIALIGAALRAERNGLTEVVELRVAAIAGVLSSQLRHVIPDPLLEKRRNVNTKSAGDRFRSPAELVPPQRACLL
jgi:hypothetical protein